ncbi:hypothetical protein DMB68_08140 [Flavobacterium hydrophilum]|uniref:Leucine-rich repeat domain-containing protein n=1 Tax=Flavobacterium hydrophilum TaxID=2211445 RepID=A0A2V4CAD1_9FLAO|nr:hypothetical protein DMB68_08140 [Flavobacterium hydrophilum]
MKQIILVIFLIFTFIKLNAQNIDFKDSNFKNALFENKIKIDLNNDGIIQVDEAEKVTDLNLMKKNISDITEIKYFKNLKTLSLTNNNLKILKVENLLFFRRFILCKK